MIAREIERENGFAGNSFVAVPFGDLMWWAAQITFLQCLLFWYVIWGRKLFESTKNVQKSNSSQNRLITL